MRLQAPDSTLLRTLFYVEDNPANLELVEKLIARRTELRLLSAADGNLGIEFARTYQPDVILMDIHPTEAASAYALSGVSMRLRQSSRVRVASRLIA